MLLSVIATFFNLKFCFILNRTLLREGLGRTTTLIVTLTGMKPAKIAIHPVKVDRIA